MSPYHYATHTTFDVCQTGNTQKCQNLKSSRFKDFGLVAKLPYLAHLPNFKIPPNLPDFKLREFHNLPKFKLRLSQIQVRGISQIFPNLSSGRSGTFPI
jgi:hypothetical protein